MPKRARSTYRRKKPLSYGTYMLAKEIDRARIAQAKKDSLANAIATAAGAGTTAKSMTDAIVKGRLGIPPAPYVKGQGAYNLGRLGRDIRDFGRTSGINLANVMKAATFAKSLMGSGLYGGQGSYTDNQLIEGGRMAQSVTGANDETDTLVITDCEFVKDIFAPTVSSGSSTFASQTINVNAGLSQFAPNLSQIACNYSEYELHQLVFELRPVISESNVNNGQTGTAMMVFNYNPNEDPYDNKEDVMQAHGSISGRIVDGLRCGVECDDSKTNKTEFFVRTGPVPYGKDADEYDMGVLTIATNNIPAAFSNTQLFELWVYYTVQLRKRKAGAIRLNNQQKDMFLCCGDVAFSSLFASQLVSGVNGVLYSQQNNLGTQLSNKFSSGSAVAQSIIITFPADYNGVVEIKLTVDGSGFTGTLLTTAAVGGNVSTITDLYGIPGTTPPDGPSFIAQALGATAAVAVIHVKVRSATGGVNNTLELGTGFTAGSITQWELTLSEYTTQHWQSRTVQRPLWLNVQDNQVVTPN